MFLNRTERVCSIPRPLTIIHQDRNSRGFGAALFNTYFPRCPVLYDFGSVVCVDCGNGTFQTFTIIGTLNHVGTITNTADAAYYIAMHK